MAAAHLVFKAYHGVLEEEEKRQEIEKLFKKIMTKNFPNCLKKIDIQNQKMESPKQEESQKGHTKTHYN